MLSKFITKRKIALIIFFFFLISSLLSQSAQAFNTPESTYQYQFESAIKSEEMNLQSFVYETLKAVIGSIMHLIIGSRFQSDGQGEAGMIHGISNFIAFLYTNPPASGVQYLADMGKRLNIIQPAYAQGIGFEKMAAFREIWQAFRNITYVFFVLILVIMGFAIMFRVKINPQTVITIQSALPKVIIALILITFSYAIVGLLIDFMFVAANLILFTFVKLTPIQALIDLTGYDLMITSDIKAFGVILLGGLFPSLAIMTFFTILPTLAGAALGPVTLGMGVIFSLLIILILAIVFLIALIRVFWSLLKAYVMVVLQLIFAPFIILVGVLPGSNAITGWFRNLIANLAVFPATLAMILLSYYLISYALENLFEPVFEFLAGKIGFTEFMGRLPESIGLEALGQMTILCFLSLGFLLMAPKISDMIKSFMAGKPFEYGTALGEAAGPVTGLGRAGAVTGAGAIYQRGTERGGKWPQGSTRGEIARAATEFFQKRAGGR